MTLCEAHNACTTRNTQVVPDALMQKQFRTFLGNEGLAPRKGFRMVDP